MSPRAAFVFDPALTQYQIPESHPLTPRRLRWTYELLEAYDAFDGSDSLLARPRMATEEEILTFHTPQYLEAVKSFSRGERLSERWRFHFSDYGDNPTFPGMYEASCLSTGATLVAAEMVASGQVQVAFNISGGLHHAMPDRASGFCIFNDPVIGINYLLERGKRVVYVDIDAHHGDGVQHAYYDTSQVLTISLHESGRYLFPGTGTTGEVGEGKGYGYAVNLPLYPYTEDDTYLWAFGEVVPPLIRAFEPDVLVTQLGVDTYYTDPLAHLNLTTRGYVSLIVEFHRFGIPWLAMGGGGYDPGAVARCWTLAYGIMAGREWPDELPGGERERLGTAGLRDAADPPVMKSLGREARHFAESSVAQLQRTVFPIHGLSPTG